jgi:prepilin-type N-terminal cleavage/methylation domain-containing protein
MGNINQFLGAARRSATLKSDGRGAAGFSLLELLLVVALIGIVSGLAVVITSKVMPTIRADSALRLATSQLRLSRQQAMDQRRNFTVTFQGTNEILIVRNELTGPNTQIADYFLPNNATYMLFTGEPDTPDGFGKTSAVNFNGGTTINLMSDGSVTDASGNPVNGTVFMGIAGNPLTARAVTVMGATGRIRAYRFDGSKFF